MHGLPSDLAEYIEDCRVTASAHHTDVAVYLATPSDRYEASKLARSCAESDDLPGAAAIVRALYTTATTDAERTEALSIGDFSISEDDWAQSPELQDYRLWHLTADGRLNMAASFARDIGKQPQLYLQLAYSAMLTNGVPLMPPLPADDLYEGEILTFGDLAEVAALHGLLGLALRSAGEHLVRNPEAPLFFGNFFAALCWHLAKAKVPLSQYLTSEAASYLQSEAAQTLERDA